MKEMVREREGESVGVIGGGEGEREREIGMERGKQRVNAGHK